MPRQAGSCRLSQTLGILLRSSHPLSRPNPQSHVETSCFSATARTLLQHPAFSRRLASFRKRQKPSASLPKHGVYRHRAWPSNWVSSRTMRGTATWHTAKRSVFPTSWFSEIWCSETGALVGLCHATALATRLRNVILPLEPLVTKCLTLPSRGRHKGYALAPPLMSNVRHSRTLPQQT
jgi:hypothetical protein